MVFKGKGNQMMFFTSWLFFALGSAVFAALTALFGKIGVESVPSNLATLIRTVVILGLTVIVVSIKNQWRPLSEISSRGLIFLVVSGIATGFSWLCYYRALQLGPASKVIPVDKLSVPLAMILAFLFLGESISLKVLLGGLLIVAGSIIIAI